MALSKNAAVIYKYLVHEVLPTKQVVTYGDVSTSTEVPLGEGGGPMTTALYEIFQGCDQHKLPPLTSIVVQKENLYDLSRKHGMPGGGYLVAEAVSENLANRRRDTGLQDWKPPQRPPDTNNWRMKEMIEAHQDSGWSFTGSLPSTL